MKVFLILCGIAILTVSGIIGAILDMKYHVKAPALFWFIGSFWGIIAGLFVMASQKD